VPFYENPIPLRPMGTTTYDRRLNLEGVLSFGTHQPCHTYTQLYRTGVIEAVHGDLLAHEYNRQRVIPSIAFEQEVLNYLPRCLQVLQGLGAFCPVVVALTLTKTKGLVMGLDQWGSVPGDPIDADTLILPETIVNEFSIPAHKILKSMFDLV